MPGKLAGICWPTEPYQLVTWVSTQAGRPPPPRDLMLTKQSKSWMKTCKNRDNQNYSRYYHIPRLEKLWVSVQIHPVQQHCFQVCWWFVSLSQTYHCLFANSLQVELLESLYFLQLVENVCKIFFSKGNSKVYWLKWYLGIINDLSNPNLKIIFSNKPLFDVWERNFHLTMYLP